MSFIKFSAAVSAQVASMGKDLFVVDVERDAVWEQYLAAFPEGTDPFFRQRTEHDCSCCRHFVRDIGHVVAIKDGQIVTIWDVDVPPPYDVVVQVLADFVRTKVIKNIFTPISATIGTAKNREMIDGKAHTWDHFHAKVPSTIVNRDSGPARSAAEAAAGVFQRGLDEIAQNAMVDVLDLIDANALYRGETVRQRVSDFLQFRREYVKLNSDEARNLFVWENFRSPAALLKNSAMGTLLMDLSEGKGIEVAVRKYEAMVAPQNYRRTTALITPKMVEAAVGKLNDMGLEGAVKRRHARLSDVSVNDVLFVGQSVQGQMKDGLAGLLMGETKPRTIDPKKALDIIIDDFIANILPKAKTIDLVLTTANLPNFMSLTAPEDASTGKLFAWDNDFAWAYDGDVADSLKERVKRAGGDVEAVMRVSLGWYNGDDLDINIVEPDGNVISFQNKCGKLDVDMNAGGPSNSKDPVENVRWKQVPRDGVYKVRVDNFSKRGNTNVGYELEMDFNGETRQFSFGSTVGRMMQALDITVKNGKLVKIIPVKGLTVGAVGNAAGVEKWGVKTGQLVPVDSLMHSPNYWDGNATGQKHTFFILRDCLNDQPVRGMFNEHLRPELHEHRKVFEVLGAKTKVAPATEQLSGVGFTAAREDVATVVVDGGKAYNVQF